jgi:hypothetical protein
VAVEILKNFALESGLDWGQALAIGGGGMLTTKTNFQHFPFKSLGRELQALADLIRRGDSGPDRLANPSFPALGYKFGAHWLWRWKAHKNKVKWRDLNKRLDV